MENKKYYGWKGFFPLLTFLAIYLGSGLICAALGYGGDSFKQVPRMAALVGALLVCMCMGGKERSLEYRMDTFCKGMSNQGTMIMIMCSCCRAPSPASQRPWVACRPLQTWA